MENIESFAEWLKSARTEKGISQGELAEMTEVSKAAISRYESGKRIPRYDCGVRIKDALSKKKVSEVDEKVTEDGSK